MIKKNMHKKNNKKIKIDKFKTYLKMIKNSVGSRVFRNLYIIEEEKSKDILKDGKLSCAVFVSGILFLNNLIDKPHATVTGVIKTLQKIGWTKTEARKIPHGAIIVWGKNSVSKSNHRHIGFYIGAKKAVSNNSLNGFPVMHNLEKDERKIESIWIKKDFFK